MIPYFFLCWTIDVLFVNRPIQVCVCVRACVCVCVWTTDPPMKGWMRAVSTCVAARNGASLAVASHSLSSCAGVEVLAVQRLLLKGLPPGTSST